MFKFKRFTIRQEHCAMKVGTDGVLLGAWAAGGNHLPHTVNRVLDIGTGTGLIALMIAQRFTNAEVTGIDIDNAAVKQARENVVSSSFSQRINILHKSLQEYIEECKATGHFDLIVCNPPFFDNSLSCPDPKRTMARHNATLPFRTLMKGARRMMAADGLLAVIIPSEYRQKIEDEAIFAGLLMSRRTAVVTKNGKKPQRFLLEFSLNATPIDESTLYLESEEYRNLTYDFYLTKAENS